jgi:hypothetical protein
MDKSIGHYRQLLGRYAQCGLARALDRSAALSTLAGDSPAAERAADEVNAIRGDLHLTSDNLGHA